VKIDVRPNELNLTTTPEIPIATLIDVDNPRSCTEEGGRTTGPIWVLWRCAAEYIWASAFAGLVVCEKFGGGWEAEMSVEDYRAGDVVSVLWGVWGRGWEVAGCGGKGDDA
jgi:hypothetical protein